MAGVQNLSSATAPDISEKSSTAAATSAAAASTGAAAAASASTTQARRTGQNSPKRPSAGASPKVAAAAAVAAAGLSRGRGRTNKAGTVPKAAAAVAEMLQGASLCSDTDAIFKSLAGVLAEAQEESQQVGLTLSEHWLSPFFVVAAVFSELRAVVCDFRP